MIEKLNLQFWGRCGINNKMAYHFRQQKLFINYIHPQLFISGYKQHGHDDQQLILHELIYNFDGTKMKQNIFLK